MLAMVGNDKVCACTGIRSCLLCNEKHINETSVDLIFWYCPKCKGIFAGDICMLPSCVDDWCSYHVNEYAMDNITVKGISLIENFVTADEENILFEEINKDMWKPSQSGRRKQDFGPKANFKRKKLKLGNFTGLPWYCKFVVDRMNDLDLLRNFSPVELCNLEYTQERGSSIDPHIDDTWLWGDQLVTVNLLSRTLLTLTNAHSGTLLAHNSLSIDNINDIQSTTGVEIQIPLSARSLLILDDEARYNWQHCIKPNHIVGKRLAMTFRNLSSGFAKNLDEETIGKTIIDLAKTFSGKVCA